ncbi:hypothetical protein BGW36DRAFT_183401 [Talaromyces proteolyticus]|uniref:Uncharacterized protein n=1 Tax=Talaromyces proteolyticus TaxID=1131652 RepID=A0AAD4PZR3_9EURO|nr:uncharacterized protein BGW36DRAFT_183401 [Talaromyces proteolyticus]KAH8696246.1 hypothetical protein BGW36DRAFT_183401 [Talaromyces proteolyticus]
MSKSTTLTIPPAPNPALLRCIITHPLRKMRTATYSKRRCPNEPSSTADSSPYQTIHTAPPTAPLPWHWQCHKCNHIWRIAVRRCLGCGHAMCTKREGERGRDCRMGFDYEGWQRRFAWREVRQEEKGEERIMTLRPGRRRLAMVQSEQRVRKYSCWEDCMYPSQCAHERVRFKGRLETIREDEY